jgi:hypothetical protein
MEVKGYFGHDGMRRNAFGPVPPLLYVRFCAFVDFAYISVVFIVTDVFASTNFAEAVLFSVFSKRA